MSENLKQKISISESDRMREEDPFTEQFVSDKENHIIQYTSRFEYDINRHRTKAIYEKPEDCWGLPIYPNVSMTEAEKEMSLRKYDLFYATLDAIIDKQLRLFDRLLIWDIHSYNHRRQGAGAEFDPGELNPEIIIGTNNYQFISAEWRPLVDKIQQLFIQQQFEGDFSNRATRESHLDVRQNVKFPGGFMSQYINHKYTGRVCCLAIEFKKIWMNEWTQEIDTECFDRLKKIFNVVCQGVSLDF